MADEIIPPRQRSTRRTAVSLDRSGGAVQTDRAGADINTIVAQYRKNGTLPAVRMLNPLYGDFTFPEDPHSVFEAVAQAQDRFDHLPAAVRAAAGNDPATFLAMMDDEQARDELVKAGLQIVDEAAPASPPQPSETAPAAQPETPSSAPPGDETPPAS